MVKVSYNLNKEDAYNNHNNDPRNLNKDQEHIAYAYIN